MNHAIAVIQGIHPGLILERELKKRKLAKGKFALALGEYPQTLTAITKAKRNMNTVLALKIEQALGFEEGYLMTLQVYYDIQQIKNKEPHAHPDLSILRAVLFWDTDIKKIDWQKQKQAVIQRVFERGNEAEKQEIMRFYNLDEKQLKTYAAL
jgi:antitoxin HigA-1